MASCDGEISRRLWLKSLSSTGGPSWRVCEVGPEVSVSKPEVAATETSAGYTVRVMNVHSSRELSLKVAPSETVDALKDRLSAMVGVRSSQIVLAFKGKQLGNSERVQTLGSRTDPPLLILALRTLFTAFDTSRLTDSITVSDDGRTVTASGGWVNIYTTAQLPSTGTMRWRYTFEQTCSMMVGFASLEANESCFHSQPGVAYLYYLNGQATYPNYNSIPFSLNMQPGYVLEMEYNASSGTLIMEADGQSITVYEGLSLSGPHVPVLETSGSVICHIELVG